MSLKKDGSQYAHTKSKTQVQTPTQKYQSLKEILIINEIGVFQLHLLERFQADSGSDQTEKPKKTFVLFIASIKNIGKFTKLDGNSSSFQLNSPKAKMPG